METITILLILSCVLNLISCIYILIKFISKKPSCTLDEALYIISTIISVQKNKYIRGLNVLSKKHAILQRDGSTTLPNDSIPEYAESKKKLKSAITKKIVRNMSDTVRKKLMVYYSDRGFIDFLIGELDKDE